MELYLQDWIVKVQEPLGEDGGEEKEDSPMYLCVVGWKKERT